MGLRSPGTPTKSPYELARERASQRAQSSAQTNIGAMQRRFAAQGALNSGSAIKAQQQAQQQADEQREAAIKDIDTAEVHESGQRQFQADEAQKQRDFQAQQSGLDRGFQEKVFSFDKESKLKQLDLAFQQFDMDRETTDFNRKMALAEQFGSGGLFGWGAWNMEQAGLGKYNPEEAKRQADRNARIMKYGQGAA